jgi:hypothetical protein
LIETQTGGDGNPNFATDEIQSGLLHAPFLGGDVFGGG